MKIALITTTIYVPRVLELYRELDPDVMFFVTGDRKTPHDEVHELMKRLGNATYYSDTDQEKLGYRCSELIGWNRIMRRNIALLEAIRHGADIIITIDDDNIPIGSDYFERFVAAFERPFKGVMASSPDGWFNIGRFLDPEVYHRGFPYEHRHTQVEYAFSHTVAARVGVAEGLWLGDPDIDAMDRIAVRPTVRSLSELVRAGVCVTPPTYTPVNSQNTAYRAEIAPLFMVWTAVGRYDDIWASYFAQRIMRQLGYVVYFGPPFVWQERNQHNLWQNLKDELLGMENTTQFCRVLDDAVIEDGRLTDQMRSLYSQLRAADFLPERVFELGEAWCDDLDGVTAR